MIATEAWSEDKKSWVSWLQTYGADKFFDFFVENIQGSQSVCVHCGEDIYLDIVEGGGVPEWGSNHLGAGLDYGCSASPDTNDEGTGGHMPVRLAR